mgnify:CR=1 FL=1
MVLSDMIQSCVHSGVCMTKHPWRPIFLLIALAACAPKTGNVTPHSGSTLTMAMVQDHLGEVGVTGVSEAAQAPVLSALERTGFLASAMDASQFSDPFSDRRATPHRTAWLIDNKGDAKFILLLETQAEYGSHLNGRYRWIVSTQLVLQNTSNSDAPLTTEFEVPVFLRFHHQKEDAAIAQAAPMIARRVGQLANEMTP